MWTYGTSGELIKLPFVHKEGDRLPTPEDGYYYAIDLRGSNDILEANPEYYGKVVIPTYVGTGMCRESIYVFSTPTGMGVTPITDGAGKNGTIVIKEKNRRRYSVFA